MPEVIRDRSERQHAYRGIYGEYTMTHDQAIELQKRTLEEVVYYLAEVAPHTTLTARNLITNKCLLELEQCAKQ